MLRNPPWGGMSMSSRIKESIRANFASISWQHPVFRMLLPILDATDLAWRLVTDLGHLPLYSRRIRSTGIEGQFGGKRFAESGVYYVSLLRGLVHLEPENDVLEVGCGSGRLALGLAGYLGYGRYTGIDVDSVSIDSCDQNPVLRKAGFRFLIADVTSDLYNPDGRITAREYVFPFSDEALDIVFLHSVFTHMLPEEVEHYIEEIGRVLRPGGCCVLSTFLTDYGPGKDALSFPYDRGSCRLHQERMPRKAVAYPLDFFDTNFARMGMSRNRVLVGGWRHDSSVVPDIEDSQDILVYRRDRR